jgi:prenyltransferase beta subunit
MCWRLSLAILSLFVIAILDNKSKIWMIYWLVQVSNWSRSNSSIHKDNKSMEAKQYSMQHEVGAQSEPFDKSRAMHTQYVGLTNVYYIQNNRDIHKVTLNPFTLKPLFQSQTLLSTK